jgi:penicillin-binding protein 1A
MKMRTALAKSKNMVSIRILQSIGTHYAQDYAGRFGFDAGQASTLSDHGAGRWVGHALADGDRLFAYLPMAATRSILTSFAKFATRRIKSSPSRHPIPAGEDSIRAIDPRNAFMMDNMLRDVTIYGTAARASVTLKRQDLAGKTGTTNEYMDAWFCGYQMTVVGCAWLGFDQPKTLGNKETGGAAALPIWIGYMNRALRDVPVEIPSAPEGLITSGDGRGRNFIYSENAVKATTVAGDEEGSSVAERETADSPPPKPDLSTPPSD